MEGDVVGEWVRQGRVRVKVRNQATEESSSPVE